MSQFSIPCTVYRGGTSRGLFFHEKNLPKEPRLKKEIFLSGIDAYNPSQIDGLGSGTSHSSKVVVISPSKMDGVDVDYTFYQVGIGEPIADDSGTCGNLMAAVGAFAIDEGLVKVDSSHEFVDVSVFNTNVNKKLLIRIPVIQKKARATGDFLMPGVVSKGSKYDVKILQPGGGTMGETLPLGSVYTLPLPTRSYNVSFVDVVNPFVFAASTSFEVQGTELNSILSSNKEFMNELDLIRNEMAVRAGFAETVQQVKLELPSVPKIGIVAVPQDYTTSSGKLIKKEEVDIVAKMVSMERLHRTFAGSGLYNLAASILLPGTIPNQLSTIKSVSGEQIIRIGHPEGIVEVKVSLTDNKRDVAFVGLERTARRIMSGELYIPIKKEEHLH